MKMAEVVAMAVAKKKLAPPVKKTATNVTTPSSKKTPPRRQETFQPKKCVKQLAKKGEQEIHVISSHIMGSSAPSVSLPPPCHGGLDERIAKSSNGSGN